VDQVVTRRLIVLCAQLSTAAHWLAAELDAPAAAASADLVECTCRALRLVDELRPLTRQATSPGGDVWMHADVVVSVARQLTAVLHRPGLAAGEIRACMNLAVETLSLAARLGHSVARRTRGRDEICRELAAAIVLWAWRVFRWPVVVAAALCCQWPIRIVVLVLVVTATALLRVDGLSTHERGDDHVLLARGLGRAGPRCRRGLDRPAWPGDQYRFSRWPGHRTGHRWPPDRC
jgi:hypothetical protein